jgi:hypothetical protein
MANVPNAARARVIQAGKGILHQQAMYDARTDMRHNDQSAYSDESADATPQHNGSGGSGQSVGEEDSSASKADDQEDDEEDENADLYAMPSFFGKGKGKRPAIRVEPIDEDESQEEATSIETDHNISTLLVNNLRNGNKKRTFSNLSNMSLLFGDGNTDMSTLPRPKMARTSSYNGGSGLLGAPLGYQSAIESSDDEKNTIETTGVTQGLDDDEDYSGVALISDDEDDVENIEKLEEHYIIGQERYVPPDSFSHEFSILRHASVDSNGSEFLGFGNLDGAFFAPISVPDVGFGQFFEPQVRPSSPQPIAKRTFSESSNKRVRFEDEVQVSDSDSNASDELDGATFPDLFLDQDKLPPSLYQLMEVDNNSDNEDFPSSASEHSYWDLGQDDTRNHVSHEPEDLDDESSEAGSSGYESRLSHRPCRFMELTGCFS